MTLRTFILRRLIILVPTFFFISVVIFTLIHIAPGDPITIMVASAPRRIDPTTITILTKKLGLDKPLHVRYFIWVSNLLRGDFGYSYRGSKPTIELIGERALCTLELMLITEVVSVVIAIVLGVIAAVKHYSLADALSSLGALIGYSIPTFWIALIGMLIFSLWLGWLPSTGTSDVLPGTPLLSVWFDHLKHLILPVGTLTIAWVAYLFRMVRSSMLDVLRQDYIVTARAKGLKERVVIYKHALRNALLPVVTYEGYSMGFLLGGAAVAETIFSWPGLGKFAVELANVRDYPPLMGLSMAIALMVLVANLCADIAYAIVDPRIRY